MILNQSAYDRIRLGSYYHCQNRLKERYGITLNFDMWLKFNNLYWKKEYDHCVSKGDIQLVVFNMYNIKFFSIYKSQFLTYSTFLDDNKGIFGTCRWRQSKIVEF